VVIDFSSPNVAKEMHVGHLRSTIIGDTLARTLEFCGADVLRLNHIGDWGTQFGMLIQYLAEKREGGLQDPTLADMDISDLQAMYKASKVEFDKDPDFKERARKAVTKLQGGDPEHLEAWKRICEASRKAFQAIYKRMEVKLVERGESFYNPYLKAVVDDLMDRGVAEVSEGAKVIFVKEKTPPLIIQKSDGGFGYATTDMAAIKHRLQQEKGDWLIYVTDLGQAPHFQAVFIGARKAGFLPEDDKTADDKLAPRVDHVGFGVVLGMDGRRIRTRDSGQSVRLVELLDEAKQRCQDTIKERRPDVSDEELDHAASVMGYGAIKYADLKNNRTTDYKFSFDEMLNLQGNTAVYLLYAHARIAAIGRNAGIEDIAGLAKSHSIDIEHEKERALALHLLRFPEAIEATLEDLMPNRLTDYLYNLSDIYNGFYTDCQVVSKLEYLQKDGQQLDSSKYVIKGEKAISVSRLLLCEATAVIMRQCFSLLGITPLYKI
jgi:arginyl-tRNA synthetase